VGYPIEHAGPEVGRMRERAIARELLERWQTGRDLEALDQLLELEILALKQRVRREAGGLTCAADSASDVAQEVAFRFLRGGTARRFENPAALRAYLWTAALNLLFARKKLERPSLPGTEAERLLQEAHAPAAFDGTARLHAEERSVALRFAVELIGPRDREILELVYFQGFSLEQAAQRLGIRRDNAKVRLSRARNSLTRKLCRWRDLVEP